ncbi:maleylacetoacetate isomerase [Sphingomonas sp. BE270]|jgi:maleylacetoacetate isomerase|nr:MULTISPECIES: maleylacetoacetate isomerase [unclassified Sphingomonas]MDR6847946.1 maleylacetoacetate isomerase [Sphingomonas sp. BE137]MDR7258374.1 maleylacetoacetate isomerase [Sphingomonas sp. BE270]RUN77102.1 maleylacetoacetate isomerase [Sphingomonas sp. TF3]
MMPVLYDYWRSSASYRVRIALGLKHVAYERVAVDLTQGEHRSAAFLARNPQGLLPALDIGTVVLTQSLAIIDYLDAIHKAPPMVPADPVARAAVLAQALVIAADLHPIDNLRVLNRLTSQFGADQAAREAWYVHWMVEGLAALEAMTADVPGPFLGGDMPNLADVCLVPQLYNARRFSVSLDAFPRLLAADTAASNVAEIAAAHPDRVKPQA